MAILEQHLIKKKQRTTGQRLAVRTISENPFVWIIITVPPGYHVIYLDFRTQKYPSSQRANTLSKRFLKIIQSEMT